MRKSNTSISKLEASLTRKYKSGNQEGKGRVSKKEKDDRQQRNSRTFAIERALNFEITRTLHQEGRKLKSIARRRHEGVGCHNQSVSSTKSYIKGPERDFGIRCFRVSRETRSLSRNTVNWKRHIVEIWEASEVGT